jgi:hypothetical protein
MRLRRSEPRTMNITARDRHGGVRVVTAAAQILSGPKIQRTGPRKAGQSASLPWQQETWQLYDEIGELAFAIEWLASAVSRCRLIAAKVSDAGDDPEPVDQGLPADLVASWAGGPGQQSQFLGRCGAHLALVGDSYIVGRTVPPDDAADAADATPGAAPAEPADDQQDRELWQAYSTEETSFSTGLGWAVNDGTGKIRLSPDDLIIRCWNPHPRLFSEATSSVRPSLPVLRELRGLTMHVSAQVDSRLAGAGLLLLPQSMTFASPAGQSGDAADGEDPFVRSLIEAMVTPIKDRDSAAAVVPLVARVPDEVVGKAQHMKFSTDLDDKAKDLRDEALRRLALGLNLPPEIVLGLGDTNHWSAWQIDEAAVRLHVSPLAATICLALTIGWFQPALAAGGEANPEQYMVWFDPAALELRPDRSASAQNLFDRFAVGFDCLRREAGFGDDDAPQPDELGRMVLLKLLDRVADPQGLISALGLSINLGQPALPAGEGEGDGADSDGADTGDGRADRQLPERDTEPPPETEPPPAAAVTADAAGASCPPPCEPCSEVLYAAHTATLRALEVAGKRLLTRDRRSRYQHLQPWLLHTQIRVDASDLDRLLEGAWSVLGEALPGRPDVAAAVDAYARDLLRTGQPHELRWLAGALDRAGISHASPDAPTTAGADR